MKYISTRDKAPSLGFSDVLLTGLARDGGLYVPERWPQLTAEEISAMAGQPYASIAEIIISRFVGEDIGAEDLSRMIRQAYGSFSHPAVTPLVQTEANEFILELFHGPTLAFKDVAMQLLGLLMDHVLEKRGTRATIVGATSGDTGGAAIDAFKGRQRTGMFILFPYGRVSEVQQRQMTTVSDENSHALAIKGTFDDCQHIVKSLFNDMEFRDKVNLSAVNSINWARIMAQIVYYFHSAVAIGAPHRKVSFTVPTGNFGDIYAGFAAARMGLPIERLVIATNVNDILWRTLQTGCYQKQGVVATSSPSMDIQISSNFERLLFDASGRDGSAVEKMLEDLGQRGQFEIEPVALDFIRKHFSAGRASEEACAGTLSNVWKESGYLVDPHTAIALNVARQPDIAGNAPMIVLSTAHPAKFPDAVKKASGEVPVLPEKLEDLMERKEKFSVLEAEVAAVEEFVLANARSADGGTENDR